MSSSTKSISSSCSEDDIDINDHQLRRGPWTLQEDNLLIHFISLHGEGRWNLLAKRSGLRRTGKSCRLRWLNYLKPDVKRGNLSAQEQLLILDLHSKWGNRWSKIAQHLPGRTDNEIKNYWRTRVQKQARHLNIDTNSKVFQEIIRCYWMPRLLQKMQESPPPLPPPPPPPQPTSSSAALPPQETEVPLSGLVLINETLDSLKQEHVENSKRLDYLTSSCNSSSSSSSQATQISDYPIQNNFNTFVKEWNHIGDNGYNGMEILMNSAVTTSGAEDFSYPIGQCHMAESNWIDGDFASYMSNINMDELWQFRN